mgnify:FL=1|jgi:hypothetical protein
MIHYVKHGDIDAMNVILVYAGVVTLTQETAVNDSIKTRQKKIIESVLSTKFA